MSHFRPSASKIGISLLAVLAAAACRTTGPLPYEAHLKPASADFPNFLPGPDGDPEEDYQVCDSSAVDLNGDRLLDFVAANHRDPGFGIFMQKPGDQIRFANGQSVNFVDGHNSAGIVVADFNFDGLPDVANSDHHGNVIVRTNATPPGAPIGDVQFPPEGETKIHLDLHHGPHYGFAGIEGGLVAADLNGDGKIDIATSNLSENAEHETTASVSLNLTETPTARDGAAAAAGAASFGAVQYINLPGPAISIASADFNGDGSPDLATSNTGVSSVSVLTNHTPACASSVEFEALELSIPHGRNRAGAGPTNPVTADFNRDGKPDVATANWNVDTVTVFTNTSSGGVTSFRPKPVIVELGFNPLIARVGDLDHDGDQDLVVIPLDLQEPIAFGIIENQSGVGDEVPTLALVQVVSLPERMRRDSLLGWLFGEGERPGVWFASSGNVADFDRDGRLDIALAVAHGGMALKIQAEIGDTSNILNFVEPPVSKSLADAFLPRHTELVHYVADKGPTGSPAPTPARRKIHPKPCGDLAKTP